MSLGGYSIAGRREGETMLSEKRRTLLVLNGTGLLISSVLTGWFYFFFLLGAIDLWPVVTDVPVEIGGDRRAWNLSLIHI